MNFRKARREVDLHLNLTPLVDVVLLLVLFFMVTAKFAVLPGLDLTLPEMSGPNAAQTGERLEISLTADGAIFWGTEKIDRQKLKLRLAGQSPLSADTVVVISADEKASHGQVMGIMEELAREGFFRVVLAARAGKDDAEASQKPNPPDGQNHAPK